MGVSFVSIFIVIYHFTFWVCGFARSLAWDYAPGIPQSEAAERRVHWKDKPIGSLVHKHLLIRSNPPLREVAEKDPEPFSILPTEDKKLEIQGNTEDVEKVVLPHPRCLDLNLPFSTNPRTPSQKSATTMVPPVLPLGNTSSKPSRS